MADSKDAVILDLQQRLEDMITQRDDALARVDELERGTR